MSCIIRLTRNERRLLHTQRIHFDALMSVLRGLDIIRFQETKVPIALGQREISKISFCLRR